MTLCPTCINKRELVYLIKEIKAKTHTILHPNLKHDNKWSSLLSLSHDDQLAPTSTVTILEPKSLTRNPETRTKASI